MSVEEYKRKLETVSSTEFSVGLTTILLFSEAELSNGQIGYSVDASGNSLIGSDDGDWKQNWLVIGDEDLCGDPFFTDLSSTDFPVYTAVHGMGRWDALLVADNFDAFVKTLEVLATGEDAHKKLKEIQKLNHQADSEFWQQILEIE